VGEQVMGDPVEMASMQALGWEYDPKTQTSTPGEKAQVMCSNVSLCVIICSNVSRRSCSLSSFGACERKRERERVCVCVCA